MCWSLDDQAGLASFELFAFPIIISWLQEENFKDDIKLRVISERGETQSRTLTKRSNVKIFRSGSTFPFQMTCRSVTGLV